MAALIYGILLLHICEKVGMCPPLFTLCQQSRTPYVCGVSLCDIVISFCITNIWGMKVYEVVTSADDKSCPNYTKL